jgi:hypothetical protein
MALDRLRRLMHFRRSPISLHTVWDLSGARPAAWLEIEPGTSSISAPPGVVADMPHRTICPAPDPKPPAPPRIAETTRRKQGSAPEPTETQLWRARDRFGHDTPSWPALLLARRTAEGVRLVPREFPPDR